MRSLLNWRYRVIHFLFLGLLAYLGGSYYSTYAAAPPACISALEKDSRIDAWQRQFRRPLDAFGRKTLLQNIRDEQLIAREATASGKYDSDNVVVRRLLLDADILGITGSRTQKLSAARSLNLMEGDKLIAARLFQLQRAAIMSKFTAPVLSESQFQQRYIQQKGQYSQPQQISFSHRFFSSERANAPQRAELARTALITGLGVADDDYFIHGREFNLITASKVKAIFGERVANFVSTQERLNSWSQPIGSPYGVHVFNITASHSARPLSYQELRPTLKAQFDEEQRQEYWLAYVAKLRATDPLECSNND